MPHDELAACLRAWRDRLTPAAVGLPSQALRRAPGLRREELALLAGVSANYLTRLEQGRASHPSRAVVESLARALRLTATEQEHLFRLAGHTPPGGGTIVRHLTPGLQRVLDRLADVAVMVVDPAWEIVTRNALCAALLGDDSALRGRGRNIAWSFFTGAPTRVQHDAGHAADLATEIVADLHAATGRHPADPALASLIADLRATSPRFEALWRQRPTAVRTAGRKTVLHPDVGPIALDCDVLVAQDSDLRLIVYSAEPGSPEHEALALVGVLGLQDMRA